MASDRQPNQAPPDPDPTLTPGLAPGGGTEPGDTPPDSGQESATSNPDPTPPAGGPKKLIAPTVVIDSIFIMPSKLACDPMSGPSPQSPYQGSRISVFEPAVSTLFVMCSVTHEPQRTISPVVCAGGEQHVHECDWCDV